jgi:DNA replication and repair protein RecF
LFPHQTTILVGNNASGKTSVMEAIYLLSTGGSFRAEEVAEMIQLEAEIGRIKGKVTDGESSCHPSARYHPRAGGDPEDNIILGLNPRIQSATNTPTTTELEVTLTRGQVQGKRTSSRLYAVNQVRRLKKNFIGQFFAVIFRPEDMRLIEGSPGRRRQYLDNVLAVTSHDYATSLKTYDDALKRRNRLLWQIQEGLIQRSILTYWNSLLIKHGQVLQEQRRQLCAFLATVAFPHRFVIEYVPSIMSAERMNEYADKEIAAGHTLIGPHKDDFVVHLGNTCHLKQPDEVQLPAIPKESAKRACVGDDSHKNKLPVSLYGSRGQQRLAVLWLKICELNYLQTNTHSQPILLLDDILSELDLAHRQDVLSLLNQGQAIITTTENKMVDEIKKVTKDCEVINLPSS